MAEPKHTYSQLRQAAKMALEQGDQDLAQEIVNRIKSGRYQESQSDVVSAGIGFSQGATLGFGDEIAAGIRAVGEQFIDPAVFATEQSVRSLLGDEDQPEAWKDASWGDLYGQRKEQFWEGKDFMDRYKQALGTSRGMLETARREDPYATMGGELAGGLLQGGAGTTRNIAATGTRQFAPMIKEAMKTGGKYGAAYGVGASDADPLAAAVEGDWEQAAGDSFEVLKNAAEQGAIGVAGGAVFPMIGTGLRNLSRFVTRKGTKDIRLNEAGRRQIQEAIEQDLELGHLTPQQAQDMINATPGMTLGDLGPNTQALMENLVTSGTRAGRVLENELESRVAGQYDRIVPSMSRALGLGGEPSMFHKHTQNLLDSASDAAKPLYDEAYAKGIRLTDEMVDVLTRTNTGKIGRKRATEYAAEALEDIGSPLKRKDLVPGSIIPTKHMDYMLRAMDDHVDKLFRSKGKKGLAYEAQKRRDAFREQLYRGNDAFREAREAWAGPMASKRALEAGKDIFKEDAELTAAALRKMSEGERLYYRVGVMKAVEDKLARKKDYADIVSDLNSVKRTRDALEVAFGSKEKFDEFMDLLGREAMMQTTAQRALGNSATARRLAQQGSDFGEQLAALGGYGVSLSAGGWVPPSIGGYLAKRGYQAFDPQRQASDAYKQIAAGQAGTLMGTDLSKAMQARTLGGLLDTGVPLSTGFPTGAAATTGILDPDVDYGYGR